jgi:hypothetical protein
MTWKELRFMTEPKPPLRSWGGWAIAAIAGAVVGAILALLLLRDRLLGMFWGFTGQ